MPCSTSRGPDERGCVWMHGASSSDPWAQSLAHGLVYRGEFHTLIFRVTGHGHARIERLFQAGCAERGRKFTPYNEKAPESFGRRLRTAFSPLAITAIHAELQTLELTKQPNGSGSDRGDWCGKISVSSAPKAYELTRYPVILSDFCQADEFVA